MRVFCSTLALSAMLALQPARAQTADELSERIEAAMTTAEAEAMRPGDDALTCEQIEVETVAIAQDSDYQAHTAAMNDATRSMHEQARGARGRAAVQVVGNIALGVASSYVPGLGYAQMLAQYLRGNDEPEASPEALSMMASLEASMPYMMRSARLYELAQTQQCAFLQAAEAPQEEQVPPQE